MPSSPHKTQCGTRSIKRPKKKAPTFLSLLQRFAIIASARRGKSYMTKMADEKERRMHQKSLTRRHSASSSQLIRLPEESSADTEREKKIPHSSNSSLCSSFKKVSSPHRHTSRRGLTSLRSQQRKDRIHWSNGLRSLKRKGDRRITHVKTCIFSSLLYIRLSPHNSTGRFSSLITRWEEEINDS